MTPDQLQQFREALRAEKFDLTKRTEPYSFHSTWNDAIEFAERKLNDILNDGEAKP